MTRIIYRRLAQGIPVLFLVSFMTFSLLNLLPGTVAQDILGLNATPDGIRVLDKQLGLNGPFFARYIHWLGKVLTGHLGNSYVTGQSVTSIIAERLPVTAEIVLLSLFLALLFAIPLALISAYRPRSIVDRLSLGISMLGISTPAFVVGLLLVWIFAVKLGIFPATGFIPLRVSLFENLRSALLPAITISGGIFASYTRVLRADLVDQFNSAEYVSVAMAKGVSRWKVLLRHTFRNAVFPLLTVVGLHIATIIAGTVIVEQVFAIPGMGLELFNAIQDKDFPIVQDFVLLAATCVVLANLTVDILYQVLDPRVRYGNASR